MRWILTSSFPILVALATSLTYIGCFGLLSLGHLETNAAAISRESEDSSLTDGFAESSDAILVRKRRSTVAPKGNATFSLERTYPVENITHMTYGQRISFKLTIEFPNRETDMSVELFAPDNETEVMMLCNWNIIHVGGKTNVNKTHVLATAVAEGRNGAKWPYTRVVLNLGNVTLIDALGTADTDYAVIIVFDSVMIKTDVMGANNTKHWVSAGAEYNNDNDIWVGQASFIAITTEDTKTYSPTADFVGASNLMVGRTNEYVLDLYIPNRYVTPLTVDIMAPLNDTNIISLCAALITSKGDSYKCINPFAVYKVVKMFPYLQNYYKASIEFGNVVNEGSYNSSRPNSSDHIMITFYMRVNSSTAVGATTYIGAGVLLGTKKIWVGAQPVGTTAALPLSNLTGGDYSLTHVQNSSSGLSTYQTSFSDLTIKGKMNTTTDISFFVTSDDAVIPRFHICKIEVLRAGRNYPCIRELIGTNEMPIRYESTRTESPFVRNKVTLKMPGVLNTGKFDSTTNSSESEIVLRVYYYPTNNSDNKNPNSAKITFKLEWGGGTETKQATITFADPVNVTSITNASMPTFTFALSGNAPATVQKGEGRNLKMTVKVARAQIYHPVSIEMVLPFASNIAFFTVCKAEIEWVGRGLPCLDRGLVNDVVTYTSKSTDKSKKDRAVLVLGAVCSIDDSSFSANDLSFGLKFWVYLQTDAAVTNNIQKWMSVGMMISTTQLWVGQAALTTSTAAIIDTSSVDVYITRIDSTTDVIYQYDVALYHVIIKIQPLKQPKLSAKFTFNSTGSPTGKLSVCGVQVASRGDCIACTDETIYYTNYTDYDEFNQEAFIDLGNVKNVNCSTGGFYKHQYEDENSLVLLVAVKTSKDASGTYGLVGEIQHNSAKSFVTSTLKVQSGKPPNGTESKPTYKKQVVPLFDALNYTKNYYGQAFRMFIDVLFEPGARQYLDINVGNKLNDNIFDITNLNIESVGKNIPCLKPGVPDAIYTRRTNSKHQDFAQLIIGTCVNTRVFPSTDENNRVRLEVIGRVWKTITGTGGSTQLYSLTFLNQDYAQVSDGQVNYTSGNEVTDYVGDTSQNLTATINVTGLTYRPGQIVTVPVIVTIPRLSLFKRVLVDFRSPDAPGTDSAVMTVKNISFVKSGENLAFFHNEPYPHIDSSTRNSSQNDKSYVDLGIFQNTGVSHRLNRFKAVDPDSFVVEYELQLADNFDSSNGSEFWMSFGISTGSQILLANKSFTVIRDGKETALLNIDAQLENNDTTKVYKAGEEIKIIVNVTHKNDSSQEPRDVYLNVFIPSFIQFNETFGYLFKGNVTEKTIDTGHRYEFPHFFFTDNFQVNFSVSMKSNKEIPGNRLQAFGTPVIEMVYRVFNRTANANNDKWLRNATAVQFKVEGLPPATVSSCQDDLQLNSPTIIKDCQITGFMSPYVGHEPPEVRSSSTKGYKPYTRGGQYTRHRYVTVQLGKNMFVTRLKFHSIAGVSKVTKVAVYKTMDGRAFTHVDERKLTWDNNEAIFEFSKKTLCRGIRVAAVESENNSDTETAFKMDMYGCADPSNTATVYDACTIREYDAHPTPTNAEFYHRGYLYTGESLFYCDQVPQKGTLFGIQSRCFQATDAASGTWRDLGPMVGNVIGYHTNGMTFGLGPNTKSYVMSEDKGVSWQAVNKGKWELTKAKGNLKFPTSVPWNTTTTGFNANAKAAQCTDYKEGNWHVCYDGIYYGTTKVVDWNKCCL